MAITVYDKLVRNKIPDIIRLNQAVPTVRIVTDDEYIDYLNLKLSEEVGEFLEDKNLHELADILEVIMAICNAYGVPFEKVEEWRLKKAEQRGGFSDGVILLSTEELE
jgi:predicted house-cleaning noncanonical NTP pyrophosphatase (MazG superfamily)